VLAVNYTSEFVSALLTVALMSFLLVATEVFTASRASKQISSLAMETAPSR
jgi:hypothetical protein